MTVALKSGKLIPPVPFFFLKIALAIQGFLYFHTNCEITQCINVLLKYYDPSVKAYGYMKETC